MRNKRRKFSSEFKARVALEAIKERETLAEISKKYEVSPVVVSRWKKEFLENISKVFDGGKGPKDEASIDPEKLFAQIGQLKVENDFLKKSLKKTGL